MKYYLAILIFIFVGTIYILIVGKWFLPSRSVTTSLTQKYHMRTFLTEFKITEDSLLNGSTIFEKDIMNHKKKLKNFLRFLFF